MAWAAMFGHKNRTKNQARFRSRARCRVHAEESPLRSVAADLAEWLPVEGAVDVRENPLGREKPPSVSTFPSPPTAHTTERLQGEEA